MFLEHWTFCTLSESFCAFNRKRQLLWLPCQCYWLLLLLLYLRVYSSSQNHKSSFLCVAGAGHQYQCLLRPFRHYSCIISRGFLLALQICRVFRIRLPVQWFTISECQLQYSITPPLSRFGVFCFQAFLPVQPKAFLSHSHLQDLFVRNHHA